MAEPDLTELVMRARAGDDTAWALLVDRFRGLLAAIGHAYRLTSSDIDDVVQTTWLRLFESIGRLRHPERLPGWLVTTARRECLRQLRATTREALSDDMGAHPDNRTPGPGDELLAREEHDLLHAAVSDLPERHRRLLLTLMAAPQPAYEDVARELDMPIGSIGPTRARGIDRLRRHPRMAALAL